jgi:hypothetical protein
MTVALLITVAVFAGLGVGEAEGETAAKKPPPPVTVGKIAPITRAAGSDSTITIPVSIAEGHRVQANPASNEFLVPLEIYLEDGDGLGFGAPAYPPGLPYRLEGTDEDLSTYVGEFEIAVPISVSTDAVPIRRRVTGELRYQACNSRTCLFPASLPLNLEVTVVPAGDSAPSGS